MQNAPSNIAPNNGASNFTRDFNPINPIRRQWQSKPLQNEINFKDLLSRIVDPSSIYSTIAAGILTLLVTVIILFYFKPNFICDDNGKVVPTKLLFTSLTSGALVSGLAFYFQKYSY